MSNFTELKTAILPWKNGDCVRIVNFKSIYNVILAIAFLLDKT